jgi:hypothetical protein
VDTLRAIEYWPEFQNQNLEWKYLYFTKCGVTGSCWFSSYILARLYQIQMLFGAKLNETMFDEVEKIGNDSVVAYF